MFKLKQQQNKKVIHYKNLNKKKQENTIVWKVKLKTKNNKLNIYI